MIVLVPVSRFRVPYETARGRPYSQLERLVLEAVASQGVTLGDLRKTFRVHERLLVEAVVTLVTAGWVAVAGGPQARFVLTAAGQVAIGQGRDPVSVVVTAARPQIVVMERVTGQVARHSDARSWRREDLGEAWIKAAVMRERIVRNSLDESQVQKLLPKESGHWVRRVGPIGLISRATHFLAVETNLETGQTRGLPAAWTDALSSHALLCARARLAHPDNAAAVRPPRLNAGRQSGGRRFGGVVDARAAPARTTSLILTRRDLRVGAAEQEKALAEAFEQAATSVAVVSPMVTAEEDFRRVVELAMPAVRRGVRVDFLVGRIADGLSASELVAVTNAVSSRADPLRGRTLVRARNSPTGSGASLLVYDEAQGGLVAVVGDHAWLGGPAGGGPPIGVKITEPSLCADVARAVASLWSGRGSADTKAAGSAERWRQLAAAVEERAALAEAVGDGPDAAEGATTGELLIDDEHAGIAAEALETIHVGSFFPDPDAGEGGSRGVSLRITGRAAVLVREAYASGA